MSTTKYVELNVNKELIDPKFTGYKLSLRPINGTSRELLCEVDKAEPNIDQYSYIHTKLFTLHNFLFSDPWNQETVYIVGKDWKIQRCRAVDNCQDVYLDYVWTVPINKSRKRGHFNFTLVFASETIGLISDGAGTLHIIYTDQRQRNENSGWKTLFSNQVLGNEVSFVILDARCEQSEHTNNVRVINCILMSIETNEKEEKNNKSGYKSVLHWVTLNESSDSSWGAIELETLYGRDLYYCALEPGSNALYLASDKTFKFTNESIEKINENKSEMKSKLYSWQQTGDDITVVLIIGDAKHNFKVDTKPLRLIVTVQEQKILDLELAKPIDINLTTWEIVNDKLSIVLYKMESGLMWGEFVKGGDSNGEQIIDSAITDQIHQRLAHLCSENQIIDNDNVNAPILSTQQLEECDISDNSVILERLERRTHQSTHSVGIGSCLVLFKINLVADSAPAIVLRHDVDACVFQPIIKNETLDLIHEGTLHALGYVQASKTQKKFITCAPNCSYAVIAESTRHIFVYRQRRIVDDGCELRNRQTGDKFNDVAEQQLINLPPDDILGIVATNQLLFVLKPNRLMIFNV